MKIRDVYLDMDCVLFDFNTAFNNVYGLKKFNLTNGLRNFLNNSPLLIIKTWIYIYNNPSFWRDLNLMVSKYFFESIEGKNIYILTALPIFLYPFKNNVNFKLASEFKKMSLDNNKIKYIQFYCVHAKDKKKFATPYSLLVDDSLTNCQDWVKSGGKSIVFKGETDFLKHLQSID